MAPGMSTSNTRARPTRPSSNANLASAAALVRRTSADSVQPAHSTSRRRCVARSPSAYAAHASHHSRFRRPSLSMPLRAETRRSSSATRRARWLLAGTTSSVLLSVRLSSTPSPSSRAAAATSSSARTRSERGAGT